MAGYRECLTEDRTFVEWALEAVVAAIAKPTDAEWVERFHPGYLDFIPVAQRVSAR